MQKLCNAYIEKQIVILVYLRLYVGFKNKDDICKSDY